MQSLFDNNSNDAGFRLHYLEVYNWGTFNNKVWRIEPGGDNALLTGGNGSGKTTLVDALLTLLVPPGKRFYNQSSGTELKKERDEASYVLGHYGKVQEEEGSAATIEKLRDKNDYSVLLAYFENSGTKHNITLFQIRYWENGTLNKLFGIAPTQLDIQNHIEPFHKAPDFKKRLTATVDKIEFPSSFKDYSIRLSTLFGMRSEKALTLFGKTVGIKVLGNINPFIRENMLDDQDVEDDFRKLRENFNNLIQSFNEIEKSKAQQQILKQIKDGYGKLSSLKLEHKKYDTVRQHLPLWYLDEQSRLLTEINISLETELQTYKAEVDKLDKKKISVRDELTDLNVALSSNSSYNRLNDLEKNIAKLTEDKNWKTIRWEDYNKTAIEAGLADQPELETFEKNKVSARKRLEEIGVELNILRDNKAKKNIDSEAAKDDFNKLEVELKSYLERKNNIPTENTDLRNLICTEIGLTPVQLPFAGELLKIKEEHVEWEDAIEKLLRNFGLTMLVPESNYIIVSQFINDHDLRKRIVYYRANLRKTIGFGNDIDNEIVFKKLEVKESPFAQWIKQHLQTHFNYLCVHDVRELETAQKALTQQGLIKSMDRNEKDDRPFKSGKRNHVLGWNNELKIKAIRSDLALLQTKIKNIEIEIGEIENKISKIEGLQTRIRKLAEYEKYVEIDWMSVAHVIETHKAEIEEIKKSSHLVETLKKQIDEKEKYLNETEGTIRERLTTIGELGKTIKDNEQTIRNADESMPDNIIIEDTRRIVQDYFGLEIMIDSLALLQTTHKEWSQLLSETTKKNNIEIADSEKIITKAMSNFVRPGAEALKQFTSWQGDTINLKEDIEYVDDFISLYDNLDQKLPELQERFKKYMDESVIDKFTEFRTELTTRSERIEDQIKELNRSLKGIDFKKHPQTYIQLQYRDTNDIEVRGFKERMKNWQPDYGLMKAENEDDIRRESFLKIRAILDDLDKMDNYRRKVTDVRNWKNFFANEYYRENDRQKQTYDDTGSLSGGEKAQFTYTILGAAIAYQFGISEQGRAAKSFRFIAVDEAFSKLDIDNSKYLMDLCQQLHLQLLVITPLDKIQVAEPYIHSCQYVQNKNKRNSEVFNLTMEQYHSKKKELELEASLDGNTE